jgi:hypothetical protein
LDFREKRWGFLPRMELERLEVFCLCNSFFNPSKKRVRKLPIVAKCLLKKLLEKEGVQENPRYIGTKRNAK